MINETLLAEKYHLTEVEYKAICKRVHELDELETRSHIVVNRCNGTLKSTRKWLEKRLSSEEEVCHCLDFFKSHGGYCNCEILFNVLSFVNSMEKEVESNDDQV